MIRKTLNGPGKMLGTSPHFPKKKTTTKKKKKNEKAVTRRKCAATWQTQQNDCAPSEDSDQPGHPPSLIRVIAVRMKKAWVLSYPLSAQRRPDQTGRMPRLIWVFAGRTVNLLVLSCRGSNGVWSSGWPEVDKLTEIIRKECYRPEYNASPNDIQP